MAVLENGKTDSMYGKYAWIDSSGALAVVRWGEGQIIIVVELLKQALYR